MECWPGSKVLLLKYHDLMSMSTSIYLCTYYPSDQKIKNTRVLITKKNQLSTQPCLQPLCMYTSNYISKIGRFGKRVLSSENAPIFFSLANILHLRRLQTLQTTSNHEKIVTRYGYGGLVVHFSRGFTGLGGVFKNFSDFASEGLI